MKDDMTAVEIAADIAAGRRSASEIAATTLARIARLEPEIRAFAHLDPDLVARTAATIDTDGGGPLSGVPVAVKDVIATRDMPTTHNTLRYAGAAGGVDAACVDTLRQAGAVILGKTVTTEFAATARGGATRNPLDPRRTPGGSSSGSAAAVAAGLATIGLGTQTGGSTIRPASFCGIFGWKPTWGAISREGLKLYSLTCDTLGLYARAAEDLELLADVYDLDPAPRPDALRGLRLGLCRPPSYQLCELAMRRALVVGTERLRAAGAQVIDIELPPSFAALPQAHATILAREGRAAFLNEVRATPGIHDEFRAMVENRDAITPEAARRAYAQADACRAELDQILSGVDALVAPSACGEAPIGLDWTGDAAMNSVWTLMQVPVVSVPGLIGPSGMPLGLSVVARRYADRAALAIARLAAPALAGVRIEPAASLAG